MFNYYMNFSSIYETDKIEFNRFHHTFDYCQTLSSRLSRIAHHYYRNKTVLETRVSSINSTHEMVNPFTL